MKSKKVISGVVAFSILFGGMISPTQEYHDEYAKKTVVMAATTTHTIAQNGVSYEIECNTENGVNYAYITSVSLSGSIGNNFSLSIPATFTISNKAYTVKNIGYRAFDNSSCSKITQIDLPVTLQTIGIEAFWGCTNLKTVYIPLNIQSVGVSAFYTTKVEELFLKNSNNSAFEVDTPDEIDFLIFDLFVKEKNGETFSLVKLNGDLISNGYFELLDSLWDTPFAESMSALRASSIVNEIIPSNASDIEKMQIIYDYVISNYRYGYIETLNNDKTWASYKAFGPLFFDVGVCGGLSYTIKALGQAAGLNVNTYGDANHRLNVFKPSGSNKYYWVDCLSDLFCVGSDLANRPSSLVIDGETYNFANGYYGGSIYVQVNNNDNNSAFDFKLYNTTDTPKVFADYSAYNETVGTVLFTDRLVQNKNRSFYVYDNAYYTFEISDGSNNLLTIPFVFNSSAVQSTEAGYTTTFVYNGVTYEVNVRVVRDPDDMRVSHHSRFIINVDKVSG